MYPASDVSVPATANDRLKQRSEAWLPRAVTIAVLFHVAVFMLWPDMSTPVEATMSNDTQLIAPAQLDVPEPPPPIERPAAPIVGSIDIDADVTISPTRMRLTPAQNRGTAVRVIVTIPVRFRVQ